MSTPLKPIKLYGEGGPNPPKVAMLLNELAVPYEFAPITMADVKKAEYLAVNPNGRLPAIHDPNTGLTLWESGAILEYIVERYDAAHRFSFAPGTLEAYHAKQWLFFQVTGQGPYYGQAVWFTKYHAEKLPSALERYVKEIGRVSGVLEGQLQREKEQYGGKGDGPWLVGNKLSYADIAFIPWQTLAVTFFEGKGFEGDKYPLVKEWIGKMNARETIKSVLLMPKSA